MAVRLRPPRTRAKRPTTGKPLCAEALSRPRERYPSHRSWTMAQVGSRNTTPELNVRRAAHKLGLRFRLHEAELAGKPDLVFRRWKTALFVHGCFWHRHHCQRARLPKTNVDYWAKKLQRNALRDKATLRRLRKAGWRCAVIWECQAKDPAKLDRTLRRLFATPPGASRPRSP
ncbi:very short patch repair endonuclease [Bradyrhizobium sp. WSM1253]|uniref:very short patch repair endonuclease n=1 Tax=Bradyrhizobium sp. WSM1253 TaxID=319003 RepID=UPI00025D2E20|nr:very short patch repair endonuclease [Bradyrhizobium sp. WSM1253]EIG62889.1 DNA mismatch endonuclease Vsr [Bradyrhizobium sp. WSM1253]